MSKLQKTFRKNVMMHLGDRSRNWLAKESGVQSGSITTALSEEGNPTLKTVEAFSEALGVEASLLLGGSTGKSYDIPQDILDMLEGQSPAVYTTIRTVLNTISSEKSKKPKSKEN